MIERLQYREGRKFHEVVDEVCLRLGDGTLSFGHGNLQAEDEAVAIAIHGCGFSPLEEPDRDHVLTVAQIEAVDTLCTKRLASRKPLAYLTGEAWFAGYCFEVDERVLVPRSFMSEWIPDAFMPWVRPTRDMRVLDLCCGSGCIGIATALWMESVSEVVLADISPDALAVAHQNIARHGLEQRVRTVQSDGLDKIEGVFDLVLCNPPYVTEEAMTELPDEYRHEPSLGLVAGASGLDFIAPLLVDAADVLTENGSLIVEAGTAGAAVEKRWPTVPFTWLETEFEDQVLFLMARQELLTYREALRA